jgi:hypothetical protein
LFQDFFDTGVDFELKVWVEGEKVLEITIELEDCFEHREEVFFNLGGV